MSKNIVRVNKTKNYTVMSNIHLRDEHLSWKAKGIHSYILSLPDDWKVILEHLKTVSTDGRDSTTAGIKELYKYRYWQKYPVYENGKIIEWITEIYEEPFPEEDKIKSILFKNDTKIINYENRDSEEINLLTGNPLVVENSDVDLLTGNLEVGNLEVGNTTLLNTNITKDLSFNNHSFNQEQNMNERKNDENNNDISSPLNDILKQIDFESIEEDRKLSINQAIRLLLFSNTNLKVNGMYIPADQVREDLKLLNYFHVESGYNDFLSIARREEVKNPTGLLATCIYNAIFSSDLKIDAALAFDGYK